jgi:tetratricopeptide (TPR) repeat protein
MASNEYLLAKADEARDKKKWSAAEGAYRDVLRRDPSLAEIWVQLGHCLNEQGLSADALAAYGHADRMRPDNADTLHQIGRMLRILREEERALESYDRALALDPDLPDAAREARILRGWIRARHDLRLAGVPVRLRYLILGTTGTCNASCIHCPTGKSATLHVPRVPMPMQLFKKIVDGIADLDLPIPDQVSFGLFGDGLLDPFVVERAAYLMDRLPDARISVNTNGAAFNAKKHAALNDYVFTVALHCESLVPETYDELMQPLRFERVFPKYEEILCTYPGKVLVSVPVSKRNVDELPALRQWFHDRGAKQVAFDPLSSRCVDDRTLYNSLALDPHKNRCPPVIMDDLIVDCDGQVLICCQDFERSEGIGNLHDESLAEVLIGLGRANAQKMLAEGRHEELSTCSRCYVDSRINEVEFRGGSETSRMLASSVARWLGLLREKLAH